MHTVLKNPEGFLGADEPARISVLAVIEEALRRTRQLGILCLPASAAVHERHVRLAPEMISLIPVSWKTAVDITHGSGGYISSCALAASCAMHRNK